MENGDDCNDSFANIWYYGEVYADLDADGYTVNTPSFDCYGDSVAPNYLPYPSGADCNDNDNTVYNSIDLFADNDGDGFTGGLEAVCYGDIVPEGYSIGPNGNDCNDADANVNQPTFWYLDADNDNYYTEYESSCNAPGAGFNTTAVFGGDCNDGNPFAFQAATLFIDNDFDGFTNGMEQICFGLTPPANRLYSTNGEDCDDDNAANYPQAEEVCDGIDNNCDGAINEGFATSAYFLDADGDGFGAGAAINSCFAPEGYVLTNGDCNDGSSAVNPSASEVCNGVDDNCNGSADEGVQSTFYADSDGDGFGSSASTLACAAPSGYVSNNTDCNDASASINPAAAEVCNGTDDNCNGTADDGLAFTTYFADADGDGFGGSTSISSCSQPAGYVINSNDCNDGNSSVNPAATEICNSIDDNCNGQINEGVGSTVYFSDADADGFGTALNTVTACTQPSGFVTNSNDCNDASAAVNPSATEVCNGIDDNCNGQIDEGAGSNVYYIDADSDSYGNPSVSITTCTQPSGYVLNHTDCNDASNAANPAATEIADNIDNNCNGVIDEGFTRLNNASCGLTLSSLSATLNCIAVTNATNYRYSFENSSLGFSVVYTRGSSSTSMNSNQVDLLLGSFTYTVKVAAKVGGVWKAYGLPCTITTPAIPTPSISSSDCGKTFDMEDEIELQNEIDGDQAYTFEFSPLAGGAAVLYTTQDDEVELEDLNGLVEGASYSVRVKVKVNGIWSNFGSACTISIKPAKTTRIKDNRCGKSVNLNATIELQDQINGATKYEIKLVKVNGGATYSLVINSSCNPSFKLNQISGVAAGNTYNVSVRALKYNAWGAYGSVCSITASGSNRLEDGDDNNASDELSVNAYPNPFQNGVTIQLNFDNQESTVTITDVSGRVVFETKTSQSELQMGDNLSKGMYYIVIKSGDFKKVISVVKE